MVARTNLFSPPTRREIVLVSSLLILLILVTSRSQLRIIQNNSYLFTPSSDSESDIAASERDLLTTDGYNAVSKSNPSAQITSYPSPTISWSDEPGAPFPETKMVTHVPGFTIFDRLYTFKGVLLIVTSKPELVPELKFITSSGVNLQNGPEEAARRLPSEKDIRVISPAEARALFNSNKDYSDRLNWAMRIDGMNFMVTDPKQFITHYYHFAAEILLGMWRAYSNLDPYIKEDGSTVLPPPRRWFWTRLDCNQWRDYAAMNQYILRGAFPAIGMEFTADWEDRASMDVPFVFDRVLVADRASANWGEEYRRTWRSASEPFVLRGSPYWWNTIRNTMLEFSGMGAEWINAPDPGRLAERKGFVITYISRQSWGRRMLREKDHEGLVHELEKLRDEYGYEVNIVSMDQFSRAEQFQLAGRTTIMMGVHGNGLTALLWMKPTPQSTVMEFFYPEGFAFDYEWTSRALGLAHYGFWDDHYFTWPQGPHVPRHPDGFQGNDIPINGATVAKLCIERLSNN